MTPVSGDTLRYRVFQTEPALSTSARQPSAFGGAVLSGYGPEGNSDFGRLPGGEAKLAASRQALESLHPSCGQHLRSPVYVGWGKIPYNQGSWVRGFSNPGFERGYYDTAYKDFIESADRIHFAGDHCSHLNTWREGAALGRSMS